MLHRGRRDRDHIVIGKLVDLMRAPPLGWAENDAKATRLNFPSSRSA
jgi:hypothetical protein